MQRAALYIRVSTEEQALHGYSLDAQKESLIAYAKAHKMTIVDCYIDDGYSARKKYTSRKEFMRMLRDVEQDKLDIILFIKLDRWFRSVKDYYKIQEILEAHNVGWKTTEENYDTTTTNGRLYINIRLSVAQDESDRTSDRIKFVFENKVGRGEVISGAQPLGFQIENKKLVHDESKAGMIRDMFEYYALHQSKYGVMRYLYETYGISTEKSTMQSMLKNTLYIGEYRGNPNYCEPMIDRDLFSKVQGILQRRGIRRPKAGRLYLFTGLLRCGECGHIYAGSYIAKPPHEYYYYRCNFEANLKACQNTCKLNEKKIEQWLLEHIENEITAHITEQTAVLSRSRQKPAVDTAKIKRRLTKLKELYLNELISMEEYREDYESLTAQLQEKDAAPAEPRISQTLLDFIQSDFAGSYHGMDRSQRQALWRSIIREIRIDPSGNMEVFFLS